MSVITPDSESRYWLRHELFSLEEKHESPWIRKGTRVSDRWPTWGFLVMEIIGQRGRYLDRRCAALKTRTGKCACTQVGVI